MISSPSYPSVCVGAMSRRQHSGNGSSAGGGAAAAAADDAIEKQNENALGTLHSKLLTLKNVIVLQLAAGAR